MEYSIVKLVCDIYKSICIDVACIMGYRDYMLING
jgi:hypothetical protein